MNPSLRFDVDGVRDIEVLWHDGERVFCRGWRANGEGGDSAALAALPAAERPLSAVIARLAHEYELRDELDGAWSARPLALVSQGGRTALLLDDPGGEPLERLVGAPMEAGRFLRLAVGVAAALGGAHQRGLVHKDVKPANILVNCADGRARLTGFGIASRLPRERPAPEPPEVIAGTLAYMAPEQTGRMNRSIDSRSDLYALGVTFYRMLTGRLPFSAADPMEWVHCHIARKPVAPSELLQSIPSVLSGIVMKLLAKTAEDRYQTASGLEHDLRRCLAQWEASGGIAPFALGEGDRPDRLMIPEKLYGREREVGTLLAAFDRVAAGGAPELVLVSGYSGVGKTSVVNELHKALVPTRGLFAAGKFDQLKRDVPYATLVQAFQGLARSLLSKSEAELARWREALLEALGPNGRLMTALIPELTLIVGEQPPVAELEPHQAQKRFQLALRRFIGVFARAERPLALFLDDLQWLDAATLDLIEDLLTQADVRPLLLIGAYRDNEVDAAHPLTRKLAAIRDSGARVGAIGLGPLGLDDIGRLIADALGCETGTAAPLARLAQAKTGGNPFFVLQFVSALADEGLLAFDPEAQRWSWDVNRIRASSYTDNVADLMVGKLARLPDATQRALQRFACLGNSADVATLAIVLGTSEDEVHAALWDSVRLELVEPAPGLYRFAHDRVQEAAYALIPEDQRAAAHLRIGRLLVAHTPPSAFEESIFEIVGQLNRGAALLREPDEREQLAEFNLIAGKRAKASIAYASALNYLAAGTAMLSEDAWNSRRDLAFALGLNRAECEFLTGALTEAEARLTELVEWAATPSELSTLTRLRVDLYMTLGRSERAVAIGLECLRRFDITWSAQPTKDEVRDEYARLRRRLGDCSIEALIDLPPMADATVCATIDVLTSLVTPALFTDENLRCLVIGRMGNLSLEHGNSDASCYAYAAVGNVLSLYFSDYKAGSRFGQLGLDLAEQPGKERLRARVYLAFGNFAKLSAKHVRTGRPLARHAFETAQQAGDLTYAAFSCNNLLTQLLASGAPLAEVQREAEAGFDFTRRARFGLVGALITAQLRLIRTLRGLTPVFGSFDDDAFDEQEFERRLEGEPGLGIAACMFWIRKLQARALANDHAAAVAAASKAERLLWMSPAIFERADYHFYAALALTQLCETPSAAESAQYREALAAHHRQLQTWAESYQESFTNRAALVGAEIARLGGRELDAERLYEQAIRLARANGFIHNEALAYELAARFYAARSLDEFARLYIEKAFAGYVRWGAEGKARQLAQKYPSLREDEPVRAPTSTIGAPVEHLDLITVIKVSQAVSGEIVFERLIRTLMRTAIEQAGAERGLLILPRGVEQRIEAEATTVSDTIFVDLRDEAVVGSMLPESALQYVLRTLESVILDDATVHPVFAEDPYIRQRQARSVLCLPLINQGRLNGVLYLENNLAPQVFAPARIAVLKLLASQAAIALENTRLYRDLAEREAKIRRLIDANIIGIGIWNSKGQILEANDAYLRTLGYEREDLLAGRLSWMDLTPPEWAGRTAETTQELRMTGIARPFEKEYFRKDGSRVPLLIGSAVFDEIGEQGFSFVLDLTERKQAEAVLREMQMQLAHANRVTTMGQLTASIAHEVNQPIAATLTNAQAAKRWLEADEPNLDEIRHALDRIVRDSNRAAAVVNRIRGLSRKATPRDERVEINAMVNEVIEFTRSEAMKNGVLVQRKLVKGLPEVRGDRVELQQVILNLIINAFEAMSATSEGSRELLVTTGQTESGDVVVGVRDSGPGLAPAALETLFKAFHTTKPKGLGLGLSICRSIVEAHGGRLWASANSPRGAVFQFTLPVHPDITPGP